MPDMDGQWRSSHIASARTNRVLNMHKAKSIIHCSDVMKTIQCAHHLHHHNAFVVTCRLWTAIGRVHALLVLEPIECSTSIRLGA